MSKLLDNLTPAQREAVEHVEGPLLILAGPGSGKTRVITHRIANMLEQGVPARQILAVTFTNKAADEMRRRVEELSGETGVWLGTFHRFCASLLRRYAHLAGLEPNFSIYDTADSRELLRGVIEELGGGTLATPQLIASIISKAKNQLLPHDQFNPTPGNPEEALAKEVYPLYQRMLMRSNAVDFDDLLFHVAFMLREHSELRRELDARYRYVMVDEYQDTNLAQYLIVRALSIDYPNLAVTGDPDQSIYSWRGATISNILNFERDFPLAVVVRLEQNYRSTGRILRVAQQLIGHNRRRKEKGLFTENVEGRPVRFTIYPTQQEEAEGIIHQIESAVESGRRRYSDFAIFYRVNALSRPLEESCVKHGVPYQIVSGTEFYQRKEVKDVLAYLHLLNNPRDAIALGRVINTPPRQIGPQTIERLSVYADLQKITLLEAARRAGVIEGVPARAAVAVAKFVSLLDRLALLVTRPLADVVEAVLIESGYVDWLIKKEEHDRLANVEELKTTARQFDEQYTGDAPLEDFLERSSLVSDTDAWERSSDRISLMTLHAAKGLEFPVVYITAVEEGLLPHERSKKDVVELEEERRLLFVGITRAQEELNLTQTRYRDFRGNLKMTVVSSFRSELGSEDVEFEDLAPVRQSLPPAARTAPRMPPKSPMIGGGPKLVTAAALSGKAPASEDAASGVSPDAFTVGMVVLHPVYGPGKIAAISGEGEHRKAVVDFVTGAGRRNFVLAKSPLRPARP